MTSPLVPELLHSSPLSADTANLPSDYSSRHSIECPDHSCQVCHFVNDLQDSVVRDITVQDVLDGSIKMPFTSRIAWLSTQQECQDLRRTHAYLSQGTRPTKKLTHIPDVKRYLRVTTIASDGVLVVRDCQPFQPVRERIVVPRSVLHGMLTALHLKFQHPSPHQLRLIISRYFYALDLDRAVQVTHASCHHCTSLKSVPSHIHPQSSCSPPTRLGSSFACDVLRRYKQFILVLRETVSSYTWTVLIDSEKHQHLREALLILCSEIGLHSQDPIRIRILCFIQGPLIN